MLFSSFVLFICYFHSLLLSLFIIIIIFCGSFTLNVSVSTFGVQHGITTKSPGRLLLAQPRELRDLGGVLIYRDHEMGDVVHRLAD